MSVLNSELMNYTSEQVGIKQWINEYKWTGPY